jgi:hypothetical protein
MHILINAFMIIVTRFGIVGLLIPVVGFTSVAILWPFQQLRDLWRRISTRHQWRSENEW